MRALCTTLALTLVLGLVAAAPAAKGKKQDGHHVHGVVVAVDRDKDKDTGTITVRVRLGKKGDPNAETVEKKFAVTEATRFEKVFGKKGDRETKPATFADARPDEHIVIHAKGDTAETVRIVEHKKEKKAARVGRALRAGRPPLNRRRPRG